MAKKPKSIQVWTIVWANGNRCATTSKGVALAAMDRLGKDVEFIGCENRPVKARKPIVTKRKG